MWQPLDRSHTERSLHCCLSVFTRLMKSSVQILAVNSQQHVFVYKLRQMITSKALCIVTCRRMWDPYHFCRHSCPSVIFHWTRSNWLNTLILSCQNGIFYTTILHKSFCLAMQYYPYLYLKLLHFFWKSNNQCKHIIFQRRPRKGGLAQTCVLLALYVRDSLCSQRRV